MNTYLSVVKDENGVWVIKKVYPQGLNVYGNYSGVLWHRATQMTLEERIREGIYLQVNKTEGMDPEFSQYVRTDIVFDETTAEVVYTDVYELIDLQMIKDILRARAYNLRGQVINKTVMFEGEKLTIDLPLVTQLNAYSALAALDTLPSDLILQTRYGVSKPLTLELLVKLQKFIAKLQNDINVETAAISAAIQAATTYAEIKEAAVYNGNPF